MTIYQAISRQPSPYFRHDNRIPPISHRASDYSHLQMNMDKADWGHWLVALLVTPGGFASRHGDGGAGTGRGEIGPLRNPERERNAEKTKPIDWHGAEYLEGN
ncbi:hypothetical protein GWI33_020653 [Rhynchophorus ferrugineus]|uniref:Uncharacterized protein n=1 Tax=Rhynchophorus ferrugineus TaxID=354439 RepID=A0A834HP00_RHYFE|nr:hypothetical protein GWI33_020653 [Rhynchophorus ferrugineus]